MQKLIIAFVLFLLMLFSLNAQGTEDTPINDVYVKKTYLVTENQPVKYNHDSKENYSFSPSLGKTRIRLHHVRPFDNFSITKDHPQFIQIGMRENFENYPQIVLTPRNLSFAESDSELDHGKRVTISIFNPPGYNIKSALIKILPSSVNWEIIPDLNHSQIDYVSSEDAFWLQNFNESRTLNEWFEIKPKPGIAPKSYSLCVISMIKYEAKNFNHVPNGSNQSISRDLNISNTINLIVTRKPWYYSMKDNIWIFALISAIGAIITVIFGPAVGKRLIDFILHR